MLKQKFFVQFGLNISLQVVGMLAGIVVARVGGPECLGVISFGTAYVSVFGFLTSFFGSSHIKLISEGQDLGKCMKVYIWLQGGSMVVHVLAVLGWFFTQKFILHYPFESGEQQTIILLSLAIYFIGALVEFNTNTFNATLHQVKSNLPFLLRTLLFQLGRIIVVLLGFKALGLSIWALIAVFVILPVSIRQFKELPIGAFDKVLMKKYISLGVPISLIVLINTILKYSDKLILVHYSNTAELGYYSAAYSIGGMILVVSTVIGTIFFPLFSKLIAKNDWDSINHKIIAFQETIILFLFPFVCLLAIIGEPFLVTLLGARYERSSIAFIILLFATFTSIMGMPFGNLLSGMGRFYLGVWINLIKLVFFAITLYFLLSPAYLNMGATGLAINTLLMNLLNNILYLYFSNRYGKLVFDKSNGIRYLSIFVFSALVFYSVQFIAPLGQFWWLFMVPLYTLTVYGLLHLSGLMKKQHWITLFEIINVNKTVSYIKEEMKIKKVETLK